MSIIKTLLFLLTFSSIAMASKTIKKSPHRDIENELFNDEWEGEKKLIPMIKKAEKDPCEYLNKKMIELQKVEFAKVRVIKTMTELKCKNNEKIVKEQIKDKDIIVQVEAIKMATKLPIKERKLAATPILKLKTKTKDKYLLKTIKAFEKSLKNQK